MVAVVQHGRRIYSSYLHVLAEQEADAVAQVDEEKQEDMEMVEEESTKYNFIIILDTKYHMKLSLAVG